MKALKAILKHKLVLKLRVPEAACASVINNLSRKSDD
jgi:hypothetical protein